MRYLFLIILFLFIDNLRAQSELARYAEQLLQEKEAKIKEIGVIQRKYDDLRRNSKKKIQEAEKKLEEEIDKGSLNERQIQQYKKEINEAEELLKYQNDSIAIISKQRDAIMIEFKLIQKKLDSLWEIGKKDREFIAVLIKYTNRISEVKLGQSTRNGSLIQKTETSSNGYITYDCPEMKIFKKCYLDCVGFSCEYFKEIRKNLPPEPFIKVYVNIYIFKDGKSYIAETLDVYLNHDPLRSNENWAFYSFNYNNVALPEKLESGYVYKFAVSEKEVNRNTPYEDAINFFILTEKKNNTPITRP